ncbi:MAG: PIG-L deacetylase family protein [Thiohalomonadaceae bacterium]
MAQALNETWAGSLVLGAHSDDLAFSLGAAFHDGRLAGCRPVTVFSRTAYTPAEPGGDVERTSALRAAEDRAFFAGCPVAVPVWLGQSDAPLRDLAGETVFTAPVCRETVAQVRHALAPLLAAARTVLAPLALGGHVDHRILHQLACTLHREGRHRVIFYEDLPYAAFMAMPAIEASAEAVSRELATALCAEHWPSPSLAEAKRRVVQCYASQCDDGTLPALLAHARRLAERGLPAERVWMPCEGGGLSAERRSRSG